GNPCRGGQLREEIDRPRRDSLAGGEHDDGDDRHQRDEKRDETERRRDHAAEAATRVICASGLTDECTPAWLGQRDDAHTGSLPSWLTDQTRKRASVLTSTAMTSRTTAAPSRADAWKGSVASVNSLAMSDANV